MQISCPSCSAQYNVDESRIPPQGVSIKCPRCQHQFVVHANAAGAVPLPGNAVPLPGSGGGGAVPLPGSGGPSAVPLPGSGGGPVPLPGFGGGSVPLPGAGGGSVPLPGAARSVPLPGGGGGSVPLPGGGGSVPLPGGGGGSVPLPGMGARAAGVPLPGGSGGSVPLPGMAGVPLPGMAAGVPLPGFAPPGKSPMASMDDIFGSDPAPPPPPPMPGKSASMSDIFGDMGSSPAPSGGSSGSAFHGNNSVVVNTNTPGAGLLDFIDDAGSADGTVKQEQYRVRKRSGRVLGPFDSQTILQMFARGELLGSEEGSADGVGWKPLAQIPAFASTIQKAMASALGGLDDLPVPFADNLPTPRGDSDLPTPKGKKGQRNEAPVDALNEEMQVGTGDLLQAEKAKEEVERRRRAAREGGTKRKALAALSAASVIVVIGLLGVAVNFATPYGWFGYKLAFPDSAVVAEGPKNVIEAPPPPPSSFGADVDPLALLKKDTYLDYRQAAEQYARVVESRKSITPFPPDGKIAAAEQARFLAYLTIVEDMPAFLPQLQAAAALAPGGDDVSLAVASAAISYAQQAWDPGIALISPFADPARSLPPARLTEVLVWWALGLHGKGDVDGAMKKIDEALQANLHAALPLSLQADLLASSGQLEPAMGYLEKVFLENADHPRATILKGTLLAQTSTTVEEGKQLLAEMTEGGRAKLASPAQQAEAFMGRAEIAISARAYPEALRFLGAAVALVPQNRALRVRAVEFAIRLREYAVAREHAKALLTLAPEDADGTIGLARAKLGTRDTLGAYTDLQQALKKAPDNAGLNFWFGMAAKEMGKVQEARAQFEKAQKLDPKRADAVVENVLDAIERGKLADALKIADTAMDRVASGERHRVRSAKAYAFARRRQFVEADAEYLKALAESPRDSDTRARYAELLVDMKRPADAELQVNEALLMDGKNPMVIIAAGDVARSRGEFKQALDRYEEAMQLAPNAFEPYTRAAITAAKLKDVPRAKSLIETAGQLRPNNPDVIGAQAIVIASVDPKQAATLLQQAVDAAPEDPVLPYLLGITFQSMGQGLEAIDALKKATTLAPEYDDAWYSLGKVNRDLGRNDEAKKCFAQVVRIDKKRADGWIQTADILATTGDDAGALEAYEKALRADPNNADSVCAMGETLVVRMGEDAKNLKRGVDMLERCVRLAPKHATAWKNLGNAYKGEKKNKLAVGAYKQHLVVNPGDPDNSFVEDFVTDLGGKLK
ncbi:MAG: tetratricopeptide repeat protein [Deltaproteobacteria bacterium]|nr:tetratricopeptide repeat protein [Deltaproteobacteria bacterium]